MKVLSYLLLCAIFFTSTSCLNQEEGKYIPGVKGPRVNIQDGKVILSIELTGIDLPVGLTVPIPKLDQSTVTVAPSFGEDGSFNGTLIKVAFDLRDVENDEFRVVPHQTLPDGRDFPFLIDGTLPALAVNIPKALDTTFYASQKVFGFFLPIKIPSDFQLSVHYRIKVNGKKYGIVSLIHADEETQEGSGLIVLLTLDELRKNPELQKLLKISKRRKSTLY